MDKNRSPMGCGSKNLTSEKEHPTHHKSELDTATIVQGNVLVYWSSAERSILHLHHDTGAG